MAPQRGRVIQGCADLTPGVVLQAYAGGRVVHCGRVTQVVASMNMVWIIDARNGTRRLVDTAEFDLVLVTGATEPPRPQPEDAA